MVRDGDKGAGGRGETAGASPGAEEQVPARGDNASSPEVEEFLRPASPKVPARLRHRAAQSGAAGGATSAEQEEHAAADSADGATPARDERGDSVNEQDAGVVNQPDGEDDEGLDLLDEADDDIVQRKRTKARKAKRAVEPEAADNSDAEGDEDVDPRDESDGEAAGRSKAANESGEEDAANEPAEEDDEDLDLLEDADDDILQRKRAKAQAAKSASDAEASPGKQRRLVSVLVILLAVSVGALAGVSYAAFRSPDDKASSNSVAAADTDKAQLEAMITELEEKLEKSPEDNDARIMLGAAYYDVGELELAHRQWDQAVKSDPKEARGWFYLGLYYMSKDDADQDAARDAWEKAIEIDPDSDVARTAQNHLGALTGMGLPTTSPSASGSASTGKG